MRGNRRKTILISEPNAIDEMPYLPYMWATLKSYHERHGATVDDYEWLEPIYHRGDPSSLLEPYRDTRIDVLGLSCYTWNWDIERRLARRVKEENPDCYVVVGGPDPAYKDPQFFIQNPYIRRAGRQRRRDPVREDPGCARRRSLAAPRHSGPLLARRRDACAREHGASRGPDRVRSQPLHRPERLLRAIGEGQRSRRLQCRLGNEPGLPLQLQLL